MSNIYIQEPPTHGKVLLKTTVGEIEIELWSKESPIACRNFVQLCMEGYYDSTIFHRLIPEFIVQGGDPTGTGHGGESIYGHPFKDEFHQRLRFSRRGLVAMANGNIKDDNGSQFFFTLGPCTELQKKHTIFAKIGGNTIYNMIQLGESEVVDDQPIKPHKIISTEILLNPFEDIVPRKKITSGDNKAEKREKTTAKAVKNYGLLSFGDEAEEDEIDLNSVVQTLKNKSKSAHDTGDPLLSSKKVIEVDDEKEKEEESKNEDMYGGMSEEEEVVSKSKNLDEIKSKLEKQPEKEKKKPPKPSEIQIDEKSQKLKDEIKQIQKELVENAQAKKEEIEKNRQEEMKKNEQNDIVKKYKEDVDKYEHLKRKRLINAKESKTLELLEAFKERLFNAKNKAPEEEEKESTEEKTKTELEKILTHKLDLDEDIRQKVIDANIKDADRYDIFDPRNVINKRKRGEYNESKPSKR